MKRLRLALIAFLISAAGPDLQPVGVRAAEVITYHGYSKAIELKNATTRVVLCPEVGGRVVEYSLNGANVLYLSESEKAWKPGMKPESSAGRFDIGPEYIIPRHTQLWSGEWAAEITGPHSAVLTSKKDSATGVQLVREFVLDKSSSHLRCTQTIKNISTETHEWCHWSRTFAVGKGICVIPLTPPQATPKSRLPMGYVMYEDRGLIGVRPKDPQIRKQNNTLQIFPTPRKPKLGFDSYAGEIDYLAPNDLLFVKRFPTFPNRVYNEVAGLTISVWYPDRAMVELEPIGPREVLAAGQSASFTEDWWLAEYKFPGIETTVNPSELAKVTDTLK